MTAYIEIFDSQLDPDAPITSGLGYQFRNNPVAMFLGEIGAPRLYGKAVANDANGGLPVLSVNASDDYTVTQGGGYEELTTATSSTSDVVAARWTISALDGTGRFRAAQSADLISGSESTLSLYKNGVLINSWSTSSVATRSEDLSITVGDVVEFRHRRSGGSGDVFVSGILLSADDAFVEQPVYIAVSDL